MQRPSRPLDSRIQVVIVAVFALLSVSATGTEPGVEEQQVESQNLTLGDLFQMSSIVQASLSPSGQYVLFNRHGEIVAGNSELGYKTLATYISFTVTELSWIGEDSFVVQLAAPNGRRHMQVIRVGMLEGGEFGMVGDWKHTISGYILDTLPADPDHVIYAKAESRGDLPAVDLYRLNLFREIHEQIKSSKRIDTDARDIFYYVQDSGGDYVLGVKITQDAPELWRQIDGDWTHLWTFTADTQFIPWDLSPDGRVLWALSNAVTDKLAAVAYDLEQGLIIDVLFEHDRFDLDSIVMSDDGANPIGVTFSDSGLLRYHFFEEHGAADFAALESRFPGQGLILVGRSADGSKRLLFASGPDSRGAVHVCDAQGSNCDLVQEVAPWLAGKALGKTELLHVESTDGLVIESFLTLPPAATSSVPLVALPHGGPIGISDNRYFSPEVQWLAYNGFAVLQVNYRGSGGYGQAFESAGLRQWGRGIEDDIEASVQHALTTYPQLDADRVGIFGGSYGGYSALMSAIRNPDLFKCAASWAGVTDITLLFTQAASRDNESLRESLVRIIGSPEVDKQDQLHYSPVYRYKELVRPVLLGHGARDQIVDIEHSWRLRKLLQLAGYSPEFIVLNDVGHSFQRVGEAASFYVPLVSFLDSHLKVGAD